VQIISAREEFQWLLWVMMGVALSLLPVSKLWLGCLTFVILVGIPHGALDIYLLWFRNEKKLITFLVSMVRYLVFVGCGLLLWQKLPELFWAAFFLAAVYHFGSSDEHPEILNSLFSNPALKNLWILSRGALLVFAPFVFHPQKITDYLSYAVPVSFATRVTSVAPFLLIYAGIGLIATTGQALRKSSLQVHRWILVKYFLTLVVILLLFVVGDPLVCFSLYFCCHHSLVHTYRVLKKFSVSIKPLRLGVAVGLSVVVLFLLLNWVEQHFVLRGASEGIVTAMFVALAALTFPHLIEVQHLHHALPQRIRKRS